MISRNLSPTKSLIGGKQIATNSLTYGEKSRNDNANVDNNNGDNDNNDDDATTTNDNYYNNNDDDDDNDNNT